MTMDPIGPGRGQQPRPNASEARDGARRPAAATPPAAGAAAAAADVTRAGARGVERSGGEPVRQALTGPKLGGETPVHPGRRHGGALVEALRRNAERAQDPPRPAQASHARADGATPREANEFVRSVADELGIEVDDATLQELERHLRVMQSLHDLSDEDLRLQVVEYLRATMPPDADGAWLAREIVDLLNSHGGRRHGG